MFLLFDQFFMAKETDSSMRNPNICKTILF